jgi:protein tyrosine/serine phosphatase
MRYLLLISTAILLSFTYADRPSTWAKSVTLDGVDNLYQVNDYIYRSLQPTAAGMKNLKTLGVKKIINLRNFHSDKDELEGVDIKLYEADINTWHIKESDVVSVLKILRDTANGPYLVHCQHGADRTGLICAMYRLVFQNWTKEEALNEMQNGGYGYHEVWRNIPKFIREADVADIKKQVNIK